MPDPFGTHDSFGAHNNAMLRRFLDTFGFDYEFISATEYYTSGQFDPVLLRAAERYDDLMAVMLKSLREERQQTYSIFLPIHPETGRVLYVPMKHVDGAKGEITFDDEHGREWTLPVTGGQVKLQWKPISARAGRVLVSISRCMARTTPPTPRSMTGFARSWGRARTPSITSTNCSWMSRARRSANPRGTASALTNG